MKHRYMASVRFLALLVTILAHSHLWANELEQEYLDYSIELRTRAISQSAASWDGEVAERGIISSLLTGDPEGWATYISVGIKDSQGYSAKDFRFSQYWKTLVTVLAAPNTKNGRPVINALLRRKDVPLRVAGWILYALLEQRQYGVSLSWLDQATVIAWCEGALESPVFIEAVDGTVAEPPKLPLMPGPNRPTYRPYTYDIDSQRLAAWLYNDIIGIACDVPRDQSILGLPSHDKAWNNAVISARGKMPLAQSQVLLRENALKLIDRRAEVYMGKEQVRSLVQCYFLSQPGDAASFGRDIAWACSLIDAGDPRALAAADEIVRLIHIFVISGGYMKKGPLSESGQTDLTVEGIRALARAPNVADLQSVSGLKAWAAPIIRWHRRESRSMPGIAGPNEWSLVMSALGIVEDPDHP